MFDGESVKHYRIKRLDGEGFFLSRLKTFETLNEFVDYYSKNSDGLCVMLGKPCPKVRVNVCTYFHKLSLQYHLESASPISAGIIGMVIIFLFSESSDSNTLSFLKLKC